MKQNNIQLTFTSLFIAFGFIIAILVYFTNTYYDDKENKEKIKKLILKETDSKKNIITNYIEEIENDLRVLNASKIFRDYVETLQDKKNYKNDKLLIVKDHFKTFFEQDSKYRQIRYIDKNGQEIINFKKLKINDTTIDVPDYSLQNKKDRYYFKEASKKLENQIWFSRLDLNVENGQIEIPYVPTLRASIPVYINGKFEGILIFNTFAEILIDKITQSQLFKISLVDNEGNFIISKQKQDNVSLNLSWSKYLNKDTILKDFFPNDSNKILKSESFFNERVYSSDLTEYIMTPEGLIFIIELSDNTIKNLEEFQSNKIFTIAIIIFFISIPIALFLAKIPTNLNKNLIKAKEEIEESHNELNEYKHAMDESNIISKSDLKGNITYVNDLFCEVTGFTEDEVIGKPHNIVRSPDSPKEIFKDMWKTIQSKKTWHGILKNKKKDGTYYYVNITIYPILDKNNEITEYIAIRHEITDLKEKEKALKEISQKDYLTNEGNRSKLINDISSFNKPYLALLDIDRFGEINDFYGSNIGDQILKSFAKLIKENLATDKCNVYRLYSDQFAILTYEESSEVFIQNIQKLYTKIATTHITIGNKDINFTTACSISLKDKDVLLTTAAMAHKFSKSEHTVKIYNENMNLDKVYQNNIDWQDKIKKALNEDKIVPYYQPIYNNVTERIEKYECLIRLINDDNTAISPYFFLEISKKSKQYISLTKKMIEKSFEYFEDKDIEFSINITVEDILNEELCDFVFNKLEKSKNPQNVVFEMVESEGIEKFKQINTFIEKVESYGCKLAIDDFGTGYSNFEYLIKLKANYIKIDGSMIKDLDKNDDSLEIVKTIISFAKSQGFKTIAEYVSSEKIFNRVKELGIDYSQGFYIGEPKSKTI